jgi:hypothetical protein
MKSRLSLNYVFLLYIADMSSYWINEVGKEYSASNEMVILIPLSQFLITTFTEIFSM